MAFAPVKLILLFTWFLCGLYALKAGEEKLGKRHGALKEYYNLLAVFSGLSQSPTVICAGMRGILSSACSRRSRKIRRNRRFRL